MPRLIRIVLGGLVLAAIVTGCVTDPHHDNHYRSNGGHNQPYDHSGYHPPGRPPPGSIDYQLPTIVCASKNDRPSRCRTAFPIKRAAVDKRYSGAPCDYGRSWGFSGNEVWVDRGCRARFVLTPAGR